MCFDSCDKICGNCAHWAGNGKHAGTVALTDKNGKIRHYAQCMKFAVEPDAGESMAMMTENGHCLCHEDAFEPTDDFLVELEEARMDRADLYGVRAGVDFPATLGAA